MKNISRMVDDLIDLIKDNKNLIKKIQEEDKEVLEFLFDTDQLIKILRSNKQSQISDKKADKILIQHYGNPYITALLCLEAIAHNCEVIIGIEDICYGLNKVIVKMVNDVLKENRISNSISLKMNLAKNDIEQMHVTKIICLGNSNAYTNFRKIGNKQIKYIPLFDIVLYYDSEEYEELAEDIRYYANRNFYEIETFDETEDFEDVIYEMKHSENGYCAVILSKDKEKQQKFKQEIHAKIVCVNENPFHQFELKIPNEIF